VNQSIYRNMLCGKADKQKKRGVLRCTQKEGRVNQNELIKDMNDCIELWNIKRDRDMSLFLKQFRNIFMELFRDDCALNGMSTDDRLEVFCSILQGAGDITAELLNEILDNYGVENLKVIEIGDES